MAPSTSEIPPQESDQEGTTSSSSQNANDHGRTWTTEEDNYLLAVLAVGDNQGDFETLDWDATAEYMSQKLGYTMTPTECRIQLTAILERTSHFVQTNAASRARQNVGSGHSSSHTETNGGQTDGYTPASNGINNLSSVSDARYAGRLPTETKANTVDRSGSSADVTSSSSNANTNNEQEAETETDADADADVEEGD